MVVLKGTRFDPLTRVEIESCIEGAVVARASLCRCFEHACRTNTVLESV